MQSYELRIPYNLQVGGPVKHIACFAMLLSSTVPGIFPSQLEMLSTGQTYLRKLICTDRGKLGGTGQVNG